MNEFARMLEAEIPRLRRYARALTRDVVRGRSRAKLSDPSCRQTASLEYGTDLRAWPIAPELVPLPDGQPARFAVSPEHSPRLT